MREFSGPAHCGAAYVRMQIAQMQNGEAVESAWQICEAHDVASQLHLARVYQAQPISPRSAKRYLDYRLHQGQVLEVQEAEPGAKCLRLVLPLHAETELCVQRPESGLETPQRFVGIEEASRRHVVRSRGSGFNLADVFDAIALAAPLTSETTMLARSSCRSGIT